MTDAFSSLPADLDRASSLVRLLLVRIERLEQDKAALQRVVEELSTQLAVEKVNAR